MSLEVQMHILSLQVRYSISAIFPTLPRHNTNAKDLSGFFPKVPSEKYF